MLQAAARTTLGGSLRTNPPRALVLLERTTPNLHFEPRSSSALKSLAWLGAATANGSIAAFFLLGSLLRSDDALPYRLAGAASSYDDVRARIAVQSVTTMPHLVIAEAGPGEVDDLIPRFPSSTLTRATLWFSAVSLSVRILLTAVRGRLMAGACLRMSSLTPLSALHRVSSVVRTSLSSSGGLV
jgi:hypothetical protein